MSRATKTPRRYGFEEKLQQSRAQPQEAQQIATLRRLFPGAVVTKGTKEEDLLGGDYRVDSRFGRFFVDGKGRDAGCSGYWAEPTDPDLTLELWSVKSTKLNTRPKVGWTLNGDSIATYVLFTYDPSDYPDCFLVPFVPLRAAFECNRQAWAERFEPKTQDSGTHFSESIFVPASVVLPAVIDACRAPLFRLCSRCLKHDAASSEGICLHCEAAISGGGEG